MLELLLFQPQKQFKLSVNIGKCEVDRYLDLLSELKAKHFRQICKLKSIVVMILQIYIF